MLLPQVSFPVLLRSSPCHSHLIPFHEGLESGVEAGAWDVECLFDLLSSSGEAPP